MAVARKCDRCGRLYEVYNMSNNKKNINALFTINRDDIGKYFSHGPYDLCPECSSELVNWLFMR